MGGVQSQDQQNSSSSMGQFCCNNNPCNSNNNVDNPSSNGALPDQNGRGGRHLHRKSNHNSNQSNSQKPAPEISQNNNQQENKPFEQQNPYGNQNSLTKESINQQQFLENGHQISDSARQAEYKRQCIQCLKSSQVLQLQVMSTPTLQRGQLITINTQGLFGQFQSERERTQPGSGLDGFTYFGASYTQAGIFGDDHRIEDYNQQVVVNDFVIPFRNSQLAEQNQGRHFQIWFDVQSKTYLIQDLRVGFGVFQKMEAGKATLKNNMLINVGDAHILVSLQQINGVDSITSNILKLKHFGQEGALGEFEFHVDDMLDGDREILIGRSPDCDVKINDKLLSKVQCHIKCDQVHDGGFQWTIFDGHKGKASTNSTWIYIDKVTTITDGFTFKFNQTVISSKLMPPSYNAV